MLGGCVVISIRLSGVERERRGEDRAADRPVAPGADGGAEVLAESAALRLLVRRRERRVGRRGRLGCHREERGLRSGHQITKLRKMVSKGAARKRRESDFMLEFCRLENQVPLSFIHVQITQLRQLIAMQATTCLFIISLQLQSKHSIYTVSSKRGDASLQHFPQEMDRSATEAKAMGEPLTTQRGREENAECSRDVDPTKQSA